LVAVAHGSFFWVAVSYNSSRGSGLKITSKVLFQSGGPLIFGVSSLFTPLVPGFRSCTKTPLLGEIVFFFHAVVCLMGNRGGRPGPHFRFLKVCIPLGLFVQASL